MQEHEQRPGINDIDQPTASAPKEMAASSDRPEDAAPTAAGPRVPMAPAGGHLLPLILSGVIATIMVVAFVAGFESIFPSPAVEVAPSEPVPPSPAESAPADPPAPDREPATGNVNTEQGAAPDEAGAHRLPGGSHTLLASLLPVLDAGAGPPEAGSGGDRPGPFGRFLTFVRFLILVMLGVGCGLVALGGLALALDRPLGCLATASSRMLLAGWLTTLAFLVPAPWPWLLDPLQYILAGVIFWVAVRMLFRLDFQQAAVLLGGTMSLLAVTVLGSWVVLWAAWGG